MSERSWIDDLPPDRRDDLMREIERERYYWDRLDELLDEVVWLCTEYPMWHILDGMGGGVFERLRAKAISAGLEMPFTSPEMAGAPKRKAISQGLRYSVFERDGFACQKCGAQKSLTIDHIHPVSKGGTNDADNLQTLCKSCNSGKRDRVD